MTELEKSLLAGLALDDPDADDDREETQRETVDAEDYLIPAEADNEPDEDDDSIAFAEFDESKHPRGQPENAGQFGPGGGGSSDQSARKNSGGTDERNGGEKKAKKSNAKIEYDTGNGYTKEEIEAEAKKMLGHSDPQLIASLVGAPDDAKVSILAHEIRGKKSLQVSIDHPQFTAHRTIKKTFDGELYIHNDEFWMKKGSQGQGLGAEVFTNQVDNAIEQGFSFIECHAARENPKDPESPHNGYYTWPRFGYDQPIDAIEEDYPAKYKKIKERFPKADSVYDIMATSKVDLPEAAFKNTKNKLEELDKKLGKPARNRTSITGAEWWQIHGVDLTNAQFDLTEGSLSREVLEKYRQEKAVAKKSNSPPNKTSPSMPPGTNSPNNPSPATFNDADVLTYSWHHDAQPPTGIYLIDPRGIEADPGRFQHRPGHGPVGLVRPIPAEPFDLHQCDELHLWWDPVAKKRFVVDGHHRLAHAKRDDAEFVPAQYVTAKDPDEAKAKGRAADAATFAEDAQGHEHKGKGPGGGQFAPKGGGGESSEADSDKPSKDTKKKDSEANNKTAPKADSPVKRSAPGSQLSDQQRTRLRSSGMVGTFPPADVPLSEIKVAEGTPEELKFKPLMQWNQTTKSGRVSRQYRYTQAFHDRNAAEKFDRVMAVEPHLENARKDLQSQMNNDKMKEKDRDAAAIASIIMETGLRPTDGDDSIKHGHFGIASLQARHVAIKGKEAHLDFIGKEGVRNQTVVRDPASVAYLKEKLQGRKNDSPLWTADSGAAGDALKDAVKATGGPADVKLKDLRTIKATQTARQVVDSYAGPPPPLTGNAKKDAKVVAKAVLEMSGEVAKVLNNTATMARDNYIHPEVFRSWQQKLQSAL